MSTTPTKKRNPSHLEQRNGLWFAVLTIPIDCRTKLGKLRYVKSLETHSKTEATNKSHQYLSQWQSEIAFARGSITKPMLLRASELHKRFDGQTEDDLLQDPEWIDYLAKSTLFIPTKKINEFHAEVAGALTRLQPFRDGWVSSLLQNNKTKDQMVRDVDRFLGVFSSLQGVTPRSLKTWVDGLVLAGATHSSINRILISCRSFHSYLKVSGEIEHGSIDPFAGLSQVIFKTVKKNRVARANWSIPEALRLYQAVLDTKHEGMLNTLVIGAYTGCRINEIASMKKADVNLEERYFYLPKSKTKDGVREVPIHDAILPLFTRLYEEATDGYLIETNSDNQYANRSAGLSQRFGRIKSALGYGDGQVFHSFRGTVATLLENAGVDETVAAHIIGHKITTMTYGLYSSGTKMQLKLDAINKIAYPAPFNNFK